jgi:hypothetical protein
VLIGVTLVVPVHIAPSPCVVILAVLARSICSIVLRFVAEGARDEAGTTASIFVDYTLDYCSDASKEKKLHNHFSNKWFHCVFHL